MSRRDVSKISGELFALTYGSLVAQLLKDYETDEAVNTQLEKMGFNIGVRLIDDFLAHSNVGRCANFQESADVLAKVGFKMFLGIQPTIANWSADHKECSLIMDDNPLTVFVELPDEHRNLKYSNILCGVIRGAMEMVQMRVDIEFIKDALCGDDTTEMRLKLVEILADAAPESDE